MQHDSLLTLACRSQSQRVGGRGARAEREAHVSVQSARGVPGIEAASVNPCSCPTSAWAATARFPHRRALVASTATARATRAATPRRPASPRAASHMDMVHLPAKGYQRLAALHAPVSTRGLRVLCAKAGHTHMSWGMGMQKPPKTSGCGCSSKQ